MSRRHRLRRRLLTLPPLGQVGFMLWLVPLLVVGLVLALLLASSLVPYRPFTLTSYRITPVEVCAGAPVRALVTREFVDDITYLRLSESWVTETESGGFAPNRPIVTESAELPRRALASRGRETVPSPLLTTAPSLPGRFRVRILAEYQGSRFGFFPAIGSQTFGSDNSITVHPCPGPPEGTP